MSLFTQQLNSLQENQTLVDIARQYCNEKQPITGLISDHNDEHTFIIKINPHGLPAGIAIVENYTISKIVWNTEKNRNLTNKIWQKQNAIIPPKLDLTSWQTIIKSVQFRYTYVTIHTEDININDTYSGQILDADKDHLVIQAPQTPTNPHPQKTLLEIDDITKISTDTPQTKTTTPTTIQNQINRS